MNKLTIPLAAITLLTGGALAGYASFAKAQSTTPNSGQAWTHMAYDHPGMMGHWRGYGPGMVGTVTAVNGSTITLTDRNGQVYTIEAGSAKVQKMVTGSLSDVAVGDTIGVRGQVSGNNVAATNIMDDVQPQTQQQ